MATGPVEKKVVLPRTVNQDGTLGSFGFSIMGGGKAKIPAAVCSMESDGPADTSGEVRYHMYRL